VSTTTVSDVCGTRFAGLGAAVRDRAMLVRRFDAVARISRLVQCQEEFLRIAVEPAFAGLIGRDLGEGVMPALLAHSELKRPQISAKRS